MDCLGSKLTKRPSQRAVVCGGRGSLDVDVARVGPGRLCWVLNNKYPFRRRRRTPVRIVVWRRRLLGLQKRIGRSPLPELRVPLLCLLDTVQKTVKELKWGRGAYLCLSCSARLALRWSALRNMSGMDESTGGSAVCVGDAGRGTGATGLAFFWKNGWMGLVPSTDPAGVCLGPSGGTTATTAGLRTRPERRGVSSSSCAGFGAKIGGDSVFSVSPSITWQEMVHTQGKVLKKTELKVKLGLEQGQVLGRGLLDQIASLHEAKGAAERVPEVVGDVAMGSAAVHGEGAQEMLGGLAVEAHVDAAHAQVVAGADKRRLALECLKNKNKNLLLTFLFWWFKCRRENPRKKDSRRGDPFWQHLPST